MTPIQRFKLGLDAHAFMARMVEAGVRNTHPDWDDAAIADEVRRRFLSASDSKSAL